MRTFRSNPLALASILRQEVPRARSEFRVSNIRTASRRLTRRRPSASACWQCWRCSSPWLRCCCAGVGLYGVLDYTVLQRRREIGIRMALGARAAHVARGVTVDVFAMVLLGAAAGLALGMASVRYIASLLYQVKAADLSMLTRPVPGHSHSRTAAALPAVIRAVRIDPAITLRSE